MKKEKTRFLQSGVILVKDLVTQLIKNLPANTGDVRDTGLILGQGDPWRRKWQPTPVFLPGEFHGQRNPAGCSSWGCKESDTTEHLTVSYTLDLMI